MIISSHALAFTHQHIETGRHGGRGRRTKCPMEQQGEDEKDGTYPWRYECSPLFGYAVWAEIDYCEKRAPCYLFYPDEINNFARGAGAGGGSNNDKGDKERDKSQN